MQRRLSVASFRAVLLRESNEKGLDRIQEILRFERDRLARTTPKNMAE